MRQCLLKSMRRQFQKGINMEWGTAEYEAKVWAANAAHNMKITRRQFFSKYLSWLFK